MIILIALTQNAYTTATQIQCYLGGTVYGYKYRVQCENTFAHTTDFIARQYMAGHTIVGICATAILVRAIAPYLGDKYQDMPVISVSENGDTVVPIVGGHYGGYTIAHKIGDIFHTTPAITNAGNKQLGFAFDDMPDGWTVANPDMIKPITAHMLAGGTVRLVNDTPIPFAHTPYFTGDIQAPYTVHLTYKRGYEAEDTLIIYVPCVVIGVGCERFIPPKNVHILVDKIMCENHIHPLAIHHFASIDIKADEAAIKFLCTEYDKPLWVYGVETLQAYKVPNPSDIVYQEVGCYGVAESAVLASNSNIILEKTVENGCTVAVGVYDGTPLTQGHTTGVLHIVGIGAGDKKWHTAETVQALKSADIVVGYGLYLDLIAHIIGDTPTAQSPLGQEQHRCRTALDLASQGKTVALVCSGDASIYALASLVFELLDTHPENRAWHGVDIHITCGISAFQACSAQVGAPFNHDFCVLSLSDLLTPRHNIINRLHAVGQGDFVVALYNPQSQHRKTLLPQAKEILLQYRPKHTPVIIGRNIGRQDAHITVTALQDFDTTGVDMLSLVIIGNSTTKTFISSGRKFTYTPRGYTEKIKEYTT